MSPVGTEYEATDVDEGTYRFVDDLGRSLMHRFIAPVKRASLPLGISQFVAAIFELDLDPQDPRIGFKTAVANVLVIEPKRWFTTIADLPPR